MVEFKTALDTLLAEDTSEQREPPVPPGDAVSPMAQVVAPRPRFEEMDGNHDGVINRDEVTGLATPTHTQSDKSHPKPTLSFPLLSRLLWMSLCIPQSCSIWYGQGFLIHTCTDMESIDQTRPDLT